MGLLTYDDSWKRLTDRLSQLPHSDTHSLCLEYTIKVITDIVNQRPRNLEKLWEYWTKHRLSTQLKDDTQNVPDSEPTSDAIIRRESSSVDSNGGPAFIVKVLDGDFKSIVEKATSHDTVLNEDGKFSFQSPQKLSAKDVGDITFKTFSGIETQVKGSSHILSQSQVDQLESGLPRDYQCNNWRLLYRLTKDGADLSTLVRKAKGLDTFLLILKDLSGGVFGALVPETKFSFEGDKYYGNGLVCVWTFVSGVFALYRYINFVI